MPERREGLREVLYARRPWAETCSTADARRAGGRPGGRSAGCCSSASLRLDGPPWARSRPWRAARRAVRRGHAQSRCGALARSNVNVARMPSIAAGGGQLVVTTPHAKSLGHELFDASWRGLEPLRHLQVFTPRALARLAESDGFSRVGVDTTGANAYTFGAASAAIEGSRRGKPPSFFASQMRALSFQIRESLQMAGNPDRGEECILRASP